MTSCFSLLNHDVIGVTALERDESVKIRYVNGSFVAGMTAMSTGVHRHILFFRILKYVIIFVKIVRTKASFWYAKLGDQIKITEIIEIRT